MLRRRAKSRVRRRQLFLARTQFGAKRVVLGARRERGVRVVVGVRERRLLRRGRDGVGVFERRLLCRRDGRGGRLVFPPKFLFQRLDARERPLEVFLRLGRQLRGVRRRARRRVSLRRGCLLRVANQLRLLPRQIALLRHLVDVRAKALHQRLGDGDATLGGFQIGRTRRRPRNRLRRLRAFRRRRRLRLGRLQRRLERLHAGRVGRLRRLESLARLRLGRLQRRLERLHAGRVGRLRRLESLARLRLGRLQRRLERLHAGRVGRLRRLESLARLRRRRLRLRRR